jgi:hypothetical protein
MPPSILHCCQVHEWPQLVAQLQGSSAAALPKPVAQQLFGALDTYLKEQQVRFQQLFDHYDRDRSGSLDSRELARLVQEILPAARAADCLYFQVRGTLSGRDPAGCASNRTRCPLRIPKKLNMQDLSCPNSTA